MGTFIVYIIKCAFCLIFFYLFNKLLLSRETFHKLNRYAWLAIIPVSILIPLSPSALWDILWPAHTSPLHTAFNLANIPVYTSIVNVEPADAGLYAAIRFFLSLYFAGVLFFASRWIYSYSRLLIFSVSGRKNSISPAIAANLEGNKKAVGVTSPVRIVLRKGNRVPFSWMNFIFIGEDDLKENGTEILRHELAHIRYYHSYDVLFCDMLIVFQWFNPAAWLLKRSLQQVHEFQADERVLLSGINAKDYQLLLIKKAVGRRFFSMVNSFNHSKLKNRINMMLKEKSSKWAYAKYLYALPLAFVVASMYATPAVSMQFSKVENTVEAIQPQDLKIYTKTTGEQDTIKSRATVVINGKVGGSIKASSGAIIIRGIKDKDSATVHPLYIVDDKEVTATSSMKINPNDIAHITVLEDKTAIEIYGDKGKDRVIVITTKEKEKRDSEKKLSGKLQKGVINTVAVENIVAKTDTTNNTKVLDNITGSSPLLILNGKEIGIVKGKDLDKYVNVNGVASVTVLKGEAAMKIYGEQGNNGVIIITSK